MTPLGDLLVYQKGVWIAAEIYEIVKSWKDFDKQTLGKQLVRSADSIPLNLSEGYGRFSFNEKKQFAFYSRGSTFETATAIKLALERGLISPEYGALLKEGCEHYLRLLNGYIKSIELQRRLTSK